MGVPERWETFPHVKKRGQAGAHARSMVGSVVVGYQLLGDESVHSHRIPIIPAGHDLLHKLIFLISVMMIESSNSRNARVRFLHRSL